MADLTPEQFAAAVLRKLGIHQTPGAVQALTGWQRAEGGHWHNQAKYNPLNTTQNMPGSGDTGSQGNISVYRNWQQGVDATARTLRNGNYGGILKALQAGDPAAVASAIDRSPWGTHGSLVRSAILGTPRKAGVHAPDLGGGTTPAPQSGGATRTVTTTTPGVDNRMARLSLVQSFLDDQHSDPVDFALQARSLQDVAPTTTKKTVALGAPGVKGATPEIRGAKAGGGAAQALTWAESKIGDPGARETGGANRGKLPDFLNQRFGFGASGGQPWCAMFTSAAVTKGGAPPSARTASVAQVRQKAQSGQGYVRGFIPAGQARPGDLVLFGNSHIAMVKSVSGGKIRYVGGNQSNAVTEGTTSGSGVSIVRPKYGARR